MSEVKAKDSANQPTNTNTRPPSHVESSRLLQDKDQSRAEPFSEDLLVWIGKTETDRVKKGEKQAEHTEQQQISYGMLAPWDLTGIMVNYIRGKAARTTG